MNSESKFRQTEIGMIPEDWYVSTIDDVAEVVGGGTPSTEDVRNFGGDIPWITPRDLSDYKFRHIKHGERNITRHGLENSSAKLLPKGTVLLTTRAPVGYVAIADTEVTTNQGFRSLIPRNNVLSEFLYYLLKLNTDYLKSHASGTTFGELSGSTLKSLKFAFPPIEEQHVITSVLSGIDEKIELNQQINKTLEAIGKAIFKHWFIDFEFPNEDGKPYKSSEGKMNDSELGPIPKGWRVATIPEVASIVDCLHTKKPEMFDSNFLLLQVYNINVDEGTLDLTEKYSVSDSDYQTWTKNIEMRTGDCIVTNAGIVGAIAQIPADFTAGIGRNITAIRPEAIPPTYLFRYLKSSSGQKEIDRNTDQGTIFNSLNVKGIRKMLILLPPKSLVSRFESTSRPFRERVERNCFWNSSLKDIRDLLLPKLISGKLRVPVKVR